MFESINNFKKFNIKGFVIGFLDASNNIDPKILKEFRSQTLGYDLTFHRAFDYLVNQTKSLELLIENKFDRVLCSGNKTDSEKGIENLINFKQIANDKITIMPGGGINAKNFNLFKESGFQQIHLSAINKKISLDSDYNIIKEIIEMSK
jgi:copper homeostasis protein